MQKTKKTRTLRQPKAQRRARANDSRVLRFIARTIERRKLTKYALAPQVGMRPQQLYELFKRDPAISTIERLMDVLKLDIVERKAVGS